MKAKLSSGTERSTLVAVHDQGASCRSERQEGVLHVWACQPLETVQRVVWLSGAEVEQRDQKVWLMKLGIKLQVSPEYC